MKEITLEELQKLSEREYVLIDIRDEGLREYGMLPGAIAVDAEAIESGAAAEQIAQIPAEKKLVFYCQIGRKSRELGEPAVLEGRDYYSLEEGYMGYIRAGLNNEEDQKERHDGQEELLDRQGDLREDAVGTVYNRPPGTASAAGRVDFAGGNRVLAPGDAGGIRSQAIRLPSRQRQDHL